MTQISRQAESDIKELLANWWQAVTQQIRRATSQEFLLGNAQVDALYLSEIGQTLVRIAQAAEGLLEWSEKSAAQIQTDCDAFEAWLNQSPIAHKTPEEFWSTPVGFMVIQARSWAAQDKLLSMSEAAQGFGLSISNLSQLVTRHSLGYRDPREPNPRRARRVRQSELTSLLEGRIGG
jgi:hypothetical protein